jgi:hypothetical protein
MRRLWIVGAVGVGFCFSAAEALAMGGGWTPPWASPYAILEPQTVNPDYAPSAPVATVEENKSACGDGQACKRGSRHRRRHP